MSEEPFMEHPTGEFSSAVDAMEDAIFRLRALPVRDEWITFCAQGQGTSAESIHSAEIRWLRDVIDVGVQVDTGRIAAQARIDGRMFKPEGGTRYSLAAASPREAAHVLDALFRNELGLRPFPDEGADYAVGAEW